MTQTSDQRTSATGQSQSGEGPIAQAAGEAKQQAEHLGGVAREQLKTQLTSQKGRLAMQLGTLSDALEQSSQQLRQQDRAGVADYPETTARQLRKLSQQLEQADLEQLTQQAQQLARQRPALFLGAAFGLGLLGARFLKSASGQAQGWTSSQRSDQSPYQGQPPSSTYQGPSGGGAQRGTDGGAGAATTGYEAPGYQAPGYQAAGS